MRCSKYRSHGAERPPLHAKAMTLIELLLAIAIAVLLMGLVFAAYRTALVTMRTQDERRSLRSPAGAALDLLSRDLARALVPTGFTNDPFMLEPGPDSPAHARLSLVSAEPVEGGGPSVYDIVAVQYFLEKEGAGDSYDLVRQYRKLSGGPEPDMPSREVLVRNAGEFRVEVFDGSHWLAAWDTKHDAPIPQAARVRLGVGGEAAVFKTEILIPAGHRIP